MGIYGDLIEVNSDDVSPNEIKNFENIKWTLEGSTKIPMEVFSLYSINNEQIVINDVTNDLFHSIKNSKFCHISTHIQIYEEMFILFFEFAIESGADDVEFVHFGIVPTDDFFTTLESNNKLRIKSKEFILTDECKERIFTKLVDFKKL